MLQNLADTANGNLSGKQRIQLETYVQQQLFDRILVRANTRFRVMSGGQYDLVRRKEYQKNQQSGLDLDVVDHYPKRLHPFRRRILHGVPVPGIGPFR